MVKHDGSDFEHVLALPVSTREDAESAGLLRGNHNVSAFDVEFDIEDDELLDLQKHAAQQRSCGCCSCFWRLLPEHLQQPPDWWWRLSKTQRRLLLCAAALGSLLLLALSIAGLALALSSSSSSGQSSSSSSSGSSSQAKAAAGGSTVPWQPQYMSADASPYCKWSDLYLPKALRPRHYTLHIITDLQEPFLVQGEADIVLQAAELTPCVVLHSKGIDISSAKLLVYSSAEAQQELAEEPVELQGTISPHSSSHHQQVILQFAAALPLPPLQPVLRLAFSYPLTEGLDGFYRSSFIDAANKTKVMASTQFESIAARKAFPCFDEPSFKATFEVKVSAPPPPVVVLSNMPLDHTHSSKASRLISYHFERSPPMSTYLVAWVVGELAHVEMECQLNAELPPSPYAPAKPHGRKLASRAATAADLPGDPPDHHLHSEKLKFMARKLRHEGEDHDEDHDGDHDDDDEDDDEHHGVDVNDGGRGRSIPVRVFGTSDRASQFGLAKEAACHALQTLEELLQVAYPLPKMDLVAIPNFAAGAMENWGLLTYRETALLASDNAPDMKAQYDIATTVAHETAHQWFGDLVTLGDWSELWLNEGFATYFEVVAADAARPSWGYFDGFLETFTSPGLEADGAATSHPLSIGRPVQKLSEIDNWFDDIEYSKGGAVLRMLRAWLNQNDAPMLGLEFGVNTSSSSSSGGGVRQHARRLQQTLTAYLPDSPLAAAGSKVSSKAGRWWQQQRKERSAGSRQQPLLPTLLPAATAAADSLESGSAASKAPSPAQGTSTDSSSSSSSSSASSGNTWWTQHAHIGGASVNLAQQPKASAAAAAGQDSELLQVLPAGEGGAPGVATAGFEGAAGLKALGERDPFIKGLRTYLQELSYGSSNYSTLWRHIAASSGQPVGDMMATWTRRRGFPILSVSLEPSSSSSSSGSASNQLLSLNQVPYHAPRTYMVGLPFTPEMYCNDWTDDEADSSWWIPVALQVAGSNAVQWHSFSNCSSNLTLAVPHNGWVLANVGRYGFYRVNYSEPLWAALAAAAPQPATIHSIDLAGLLDDAYSLSLVRQLNVTTFLCLTTALGRRLQPELPPWGIALGWLQRMADVLSSAALLGDAAGGGQWSGCLANLKAFVMQQLTGPFIANLAVPGQAQPGLTFEVNPQDSPELRLLRPKVLTAAGFLGHAGVMAQASQLLRQAAAGQAVLAADVAKAVYSLAVGSGDAAAYDTVQKMYEQALDPTDKDHALRALARVTTAPLITRSLQYALSPAVRTQDVAKLLVDIAKQGGLGFNMTWEFIINHSDDIMKKYGVDDVTYSFGRPLNKLARIFVDEQLIERLKTLEQRQQGLLSPTFIEEANEARMLNADWLRLQGTDACVWLAGAVASSSNSSASAAGGGH